MAKLKGELLDLKIIQVNEVSIEQNHKELLLEIEIGIENLMTRIMIEMLNTNLKVEGITGYSDKIHRMNQISFKNTAREAKGTTTMNKERQK